MAENNSNSDAFSRFPLSTLSVFIERHNGDEHDNIARAVASVRQGEGGGAKAPPPKFWTGSTIF